MKRLFIVLAFALSLLPVLGWGQVTNPIGVPVQPCQYALFDASGSGSVVVVDLLDSVGLTVSLVDSVGVKYSSATLTLGSGAYESIGWGLQQTKPDGTHYLQALTSQLTLRVRVVSGKVTANASGTYDSSAGTGFGIMPGRQAPNANSAVQISAGGIFEFASSGLKSLSGVTATVSGAVTVSAPAIPTTIGQQSPGTGLGVSQQLDITTGVQSITVADSATTTTTGQNGQVLYTGTPTSGSFISLALHGQSTDTIQAILTGSGTYQTEVSIDGGSTWSMAGHHIRGTAYNAGSYTGSAIAEGALSGATNVRLRALTLTGSISGTINASLASPDPRINSIARPYDQASGYFAGINSNNALQVTSTNAPTADTNLQNAVTSSPAANYLSGSQTNANWKGAVFTVAISAIAAGQTAQIQILGIDPTTTNTYVLMQSAALTNGRYVFNVYPGASASGSATDPTSGLITTVASLSVPLPKTFKVQIIYGDVSGTKAITQSLAYSGVL